MAPVIFEKVDLRLPKLVNPCPIVESSCEVRFESPLPPDAVLGACYGKITAVFGKPTQLPILNLPPEVREQDPQLRNQPHYSFQVDNFSLQLGPRVANVGATAPYPGWAKFSAMVKPQMTLLADAGVIGPVTRLGLRYISFIEGDVFEKIDLEMRMNGQNVAARETSLSLIFDYHSSHLIRIRKDVTVRASTMKPKFGSIIDIDSFVLNPKDGLHAFDEFLETAHVDEKTLFFGMLKKEFLATLNPQY